MATAIKAIILSYIYFTPNWGRNREWGFDECILLG